MKKITLLVASCFVLGGGIATATATTTSSIGGKSIIDFNNEDPIVFIERGIEFYVFPDGQIDFNTRPDAKGGMSYRTAPSRGTNKTYGAPVNNRKGDYGVRVSHDNLGRVRQVGNVFINYDAFDRVKRIGSVFMSYNRYALERVGGLEIIYNRRGQIVDLIGSVKGGRSVYGSKGDYDDRYESKNDDTYYFRSDRNTSAIEAKVAANTAIVLNRNK
ncbi:hypothetical protein L1S34_11280 [Flavobacterium sp. K77]|uniref:hypothetical protein n=1 Tax=Flavobacterium sp. K77 TaxID=2910676 RepID=UPI001F17BA6C|nr:hypothetical protein [Flavobacterium sp. K77]MCF6141867.1 hypothetical protein [Flavobacterium sp. K77]